MIGEGVIPLSPGRMDEDLLVGAGSEAEDTPRPRGRVPGAPDTRNHAAGGKGRGMAGDGCGDHDRAFLLDSGNPAEEIALTAGHAN